MIHIIIWNNGNIMSEQYNEQKYVISHEKGSGIIVDY